MKKALKVVGTVVKCYFIVDILLWALLGVSEWFRAVDEDGETDVGEWGFNKMARNFKGKKDKTDEPKDSCNGVIYGFGCNYK